MACKKTHLYDQHVELNGKIIDYAGFCLPIYYQGINEEHRAVRESAGIFDVSHMGEITINGPEALACVNQLVTNQVDITPMSKAIYALLLDDAGFVIDDCLVYRLADHKFLLVVNAANTQKDFEWIIKQAAIFDVQVKNESNQYEQIALQGPNALSMLEAVTKFELKDFGFMAFKKLQCFGEPCLVSRTGYTGEDGFEIYGAAKLIKVLFAKLVLEGATPCGLGARDTLRFEAGLPLYGHEIDDTINPIEAGLNFAIKLDKSFIGSEALKESKKNLKRKLIGLELLERGIPRQGYDVYVEDQRIGYITSGYLSPTVQKPIAFALVDAEYAKLGNEILVQIRKNLVQAKVISKRFYTPNYKK